MMMMAQKKAGGHTKNAGKKSVGKRRGIKVFGGQRVNSGQIIVRQLGTKFHSGYQTGLGSDFTLYARASGKVQFNQRGGKKVISVV